MTIISRDRMYEVLVRYNADGSTAAHQARITELVDDVTGAVLSANIGLPTALAASDVSTVVGGALPAALAERDAARAQIAQMTADHLAALAAKDQEKVAALQAAADDKAAALASAANAQTQALADASAAAAADKASALQAAAGDKAQAVAAVQAELDAANARIADLTAPPLVPVVDMVQFKLALLETVSFLNAGKTLLDDANALVAGSPPSVQLLWSAAKVSRDNAVLNQMAPLLVPASQDPGKVLDHLFVLSATQPG